MALVTKSDFSTYVQWTVNIPDRLLDYQIEKAEKLDFKPLVPPAFWNKLNESSPGAGAELVTFLDTYIKPVIIHYAILRILTEHGRNITQFGVIVPTEPTSQPVSDQGRAEIKNQYKNDLSSYLNIFYAQLKEVEYIFDGTTYDFDCIRKTNNLFIKAI